MTPAHLHLLVNHLPVFSTAIACVLLVCALLWHERPDAFRLAALVLVIGGLGALGAWVTGDGAEDMVEPIPEVQKETISAHEEQAEAAGALSLTVAAVAALAVIVDVRTAGRRRRELTAMLLAGGLGSSASLALAGHSGGLIRHPEMQPGFELNQKTEAADGIEQL